VRDAYEGPYDPEDATAPRLRVMTPTHLAAIWQSDAGALTPRRRERIARFREGGLLDEGLLSQLLSGQT
jgi:hypothetical protein